MLSNEGVFLWFYSIWFSVPHMAGIQARGVLQKSVQRIVLTTSFELLTDIMTFMVSWYLQSESLYDCHPWYFSSGVWRGWRKLADKSSWLCLKPLSSVSQRASGQLKKQRSRETLLTMRIMGADVGIWSSSKLFISLAAPRKREILIFSL